MSRDRIPDDEPVFFMDGDTVLTPGCFEKCLPIFELYPDIRALTTDEEALAGEPAWYFRWLDFRFSSATCISSPTRSRAD